MARWLGTRSWNSLIMSKIKSTHTYSSHMLGEPLPAA
jgi:hypothetical protein